MKGMDVCSSCVGMIAGSSGSGDTGSMDLPVCNTRFATHAAAPGQLALIQVEEAPPTGLFPPPHAEPIDMGVCGEDAIKGKIITSGEERVISDRAFRVLVSTICCLALALFVLHPYLPLWFLQLNDRFGREHLLRNGQAVKYVATAFGGAATFILLAVCGSTILFYIAQPNTIATQGIVPVQGFGASTVRWLGIEVTAHSVKGELDRFGGCPPAAQWAVTMGPSKSACRYRVLNQSVSFVGRMQLPSINLNWTFQRVDVALYVPNATRPECPFLAAHHRLQRSGAKVMLGAQTLQFALLPHRRINLVDGSTPTDGFLCNFKGATSDRPPSATVVDSDRVSLHITLERDHLAVVEKTELKLTKAQLAGVVLGAINTVFLFAAAIYQLLERPGNRLFRKWFDDYPAWFNTFTPELKPGPPGQRPLGGSGGGRFGNAPLGKSPPPVVHNNPMHETASGAELAALRRELQTMKATLARHELVMAQGGGGSSGSSARGGTPLSSSNRQTRATSRFGGGGGGGGGRARAESAAWEAHHDEEGNEYFLNRETGETSWELPQRQRAQTLSRNRTAVSGVISWLGFGRQPSGAGGVAGWAKTWDEAGNLYWYNESTGESSWEPPEAYDRAPARMPSPSPAAAEKTSDAALGQGLGLSTGARVTEIGSDRAGNKRFSLALGVPMVTETGGGRPSVVVPSTRGNGEGLSRIEGSQLSMASKSKATLL
jgi:hypothetical protein